MSHSEISQTLKDAVFHRSYSVPHVIHKLPLLGSDQAVLVALFKIQDDFVFKSQGYGHRFFATNKLVAEIAKRSVSSVKRSRQRLAFLRLICFRLGCYSQRRATEYQILVDPFYLADRAMGSSSSNTKAISN